MKNLGWLRNLWWLRGLGRRAWAWGQRRKRPPNQKALVLRTEGQGLNADGGQERHLRPGTQGLEARATGANGVTYGAFGVYEAIPRAKVQTETQSKGWVNRVADGSGREA